MISNKHLFIMTSKEKLKKYQLRKRSYSIDDKGYITENKDFIGYFISTKEAETYANRYYLNYNPNLKVSEVFEGLMKFRSDLVDDTKDDYYLSFRKIKKLHKKYINNLEIQELNEIINSFDTFSNRKRVKTLLSSLLQYAYKFKLIEKGISKDLKLIKCENKNKLYTNPFSLQELKILAKNDYDDITYDIMSFMIHTGIGIPYSLETDYIILDGTSLSKETDFKKLSLSHLKKDAPKFKKYYINATPDKAVFIGKYLSQTFPDIYYEPDLKDYLETVMNAGYEPFCNDKIGYDNEERYKTESGIYISSTLFSEFNKNFVLSLHISSDDIKELLFRFKRHGQVLIGHCYGLDEEDGFTILKEGSNEV